MRALPRWTLANHWWSHAKSQPAIAKPDPPTAAKAAIKMFGELGESGSVGGSKTCRSGYDA